MAQFTIEVKSVAAIEKLKSLGRKKGEYISKLIEKDIRLENLERKLEEIVNRIDGVIP